MTLYNFVLCKAFEKANRLPGRVLSETIRLRNIILWMDIKTIGINHHKWGLE